MREAVVVAYGRSPVTKSRKGGLAFTHPVDYAGQVLAAVLKQVPQIKPEDIGDVIVGCATPQGPMGNNMARVIVKRAGLPDCVTGQTINRFCSSGLQAIATRRQRYHGWPRRRYGSRWLRNHDHGSHGQHQ